MRAESFISELAKEKIDYVIFMSVNGLKYLLRSAENLGLKKKLEESLVKTGTMAVGPKTAQELRNHNISVGLVPTKYSSEGILECLQQRGVSGKSIYIPRTRGATPDLANRLRELGGNVCELYVYESLLPSDQDLKEKFFKDLNGGIIDAIIFGSSLSAKNLFEMLEEIVSKKKLRELLNNKLTIVALGPVTAGTLFEMGLRVDVMPKTFLFQETLKALAQYWTVN